jgi:hypothetical protein
VKNKHPCFVFLYLTMSSKTILCDVTVGSGANQYYGTLITTKIRYDDGSAVPIQNFLGVTFVAPKLTADITVYGQLTQWQSLSPEINTDSTSSGDVNITAKVNFESPYTFSTSDSLTWGIIGDLTTNPDTYTSSFQLYADSLPSGTLTIACAAAPDLSLAQFQQIVTLQQSSGSTVLSVTPSTSQNFSLPSGTYTVTTSELTDLGETVVAAASVSSSSVTIETGSSTSLQVTYGSVQTYCSLDVSIGQLSSPIDTEHLHVTVTDHFTGDTVADFFSPNNRTTLVRRLAVVGSVDVTAQIVLNNVNYNSTKSITLSNHLMKVPINQIDMNQANVNTSGFVKLPLSVQSDFSGTTTTTEVRLSDTGGFYVYANNVDISSKSSNYPVLVAPGSYKIKSNGFLDNTTVYAVKPSSTTLTVNNSSTLSLMVKKGANLEVRGFPSFLSFGGISNLVDMMGADFIAASATSVFKYAGNDGAGDPGTYLTDDPATTRTIELAAAVESGLKGVVPVLPVMISYTINLSLGAVTDQLQNSSQIAHSFGNLILSLNLAKKHGTGDVPCGYIINPDFLGECQKGSGGTGFSPTYGMPVRLPLQEALDYRSETATIPDEVTDTLEGYVLGVNWLIRTVAPSVTFGWQSNLWGVGSSSWVYSRDDGQMGPSEAAQATANYIKTLNVYDGEYCPDFLAVDRYEADDFTQRGYTNSYCYSPYEWGRFYDFCSELSLNLQVPVMPWQIPASRLPSCDDKVTNLETDQWGSGGTYIFGDPAIGSDYNNIHPTVLAVRPAALVGHATVEDLFSAAQPFDVSLPAYTDFPSRGIFSVSLGGCATTGIVNTIGKTGPWTQEKLNVYMMTPTPF